MFRGIGAQRGGNIAGIDKNVYLKNQRIILKPLSTEKK